MFNQWHSQAFLDYASVGIVITDKNGEIILINPFALRLFEFEQQELIGRKIEVLMPSRFQEIHESYHSNIFQHPPNRPFGLGLDLYGRKKDGTEFPVDVSLGNYIVEGEPFVISFINDISAQKQSELEIRRLNADLEQKVKERTEALAMTIEKLEKQIKETEEKEKALEKQVKETEEKEQALAGVQQLFLRLLRNYPDGAISIIDNNYKFEYTGGELHSRLHADPNELIGSEMYPNFPPVLKQIIRSQLEQVFAGNVVSDFELPHPITGQAYVMDAFPLLKEDGSIDKAGVIIRNISELKKAGEGLKVALKKERELSELKSRFVTMASHEFRTPLSTILSSTYLMARYTTTEDQPKRQKHLDRIISSVNTLTDVLNDFLSAGKIEEGRIVVKPVFFDLKKIIESILNDFDNILKKGQTIVYLHKGDEMIELDKTMLRQIVSNLLSNASKFSPEDSVIEIRTETKNQELILSIKDRGMGISAEDQEHLMERFFRGTNATNIKGTGLGLHIVAKYVELLNGTIHCKTELNKGTEFKITFKTNQHEKDIAGGGQ